jgi:multicomponent Na+:H+ antiporter subunit F
VTEFYFAVVGILLANVVVGFWRIMRGPEAEDRLIAAQLFGTTAVGMLLLLAEAFGAPSLRYVGLVFASLAAVTIVAYVRLDVPGTESETDDALR